MNIELYKNLINSFLKKGYIFKNFENFEKDKTSQVILRHDVDFSLDCALEIAKIEREIGINSSYYFLLSSDSYNIFSKENQKIIREISEMFLFSFGVSTFLPSYFH